MADAEKANPLVGTSSPAHSEQAGTAVELSLPAGWKYKRLRFLGPAAPWYASPPIQLLLVAFVCFLCPGMFNALGGLGGAGNVDKTAQDQANIALYSTFSVVGFFAGSVCNRLGIKATLSFGGIGYCIYVASFLCYAHTANAGFNIFAGALLGMCAGCLWAAQGAIMMGYPPEGSKGKYISWFWIIFNLGSVIGSLIPLGENIHVTTKQTVSDGTYVGFLVLTFLGACVALTLVDAKDVVRQDGSRVILQKSPTWISEFKGLWETLQTDPWIVLLFPMFWASNWFYTYQFNEINGAYFNTRTSALNNVLYWTSQMVGASIFGYFLDLPWVRRTTRARLGLVVLFCLTMGIWGGGYAFQRTYDRASIAAMGDELADWTTPGYVGPMFLYMFYGFYDAAFQTCVYWFMGSMTNNGRKLANFAGFYKGIQSAGGAVTWSLDNHSIAYMNYFASCWALLGGSLLIAAPLVVLKIQDHSSIEKDLAFSDETFEEVAAVHEKGAA